MNKTPTWVIVIGAFMIVFGGCDTLGSLNDVAMPKFSEMKDMQKKMFKKLDEMEKETSDSTSSTSDSTREKMID